MLVNSIYYDILSIHNCLLNTYTVSGKKGVWSISGITSSNTSRYWQFFHYYNLQEIWNKAVVKYPTTP